MWPYTRRYKAQNTWFNQLETFSNGFLEIPIRLGTKNESIAEKTLKLRNFCRYIAARALEGGPFLFVYLKKSSLGFWIINESCILDLPKELIFVTCLVKGVWIVLISDAWRTIVNLYFCIGILVYQEME